MNEELTPESPQPNGVDHGLIPVLGTEPVKAKPKRRRRKKAVAKVARAPKTPRIDPLRAEEEASQARAINPPIAMSTAPVEEAPTSTLLTDVGAAPSRSFERRGLVAGLRSMTGTDRPSLAPKTPSLAYVAIAACIAAAAVGAALPWL